MWPWSHCHQDKQQESIYIYIHLYIQPVSKNVQCQINNIAKMSYFYYKHSYKNMFLVSFSHLWHIITVMYKLNRIVAINTAGANWELIPLTVASKLNTVFSLLVCDCDVRWRWCLCVSTFMIHALFVNTLCLLFLLLFLVTICFCNIQLLFWMRQVFMGAAQSRSVLVYTDACHQVAYAAVCSAMKELELIKDTQTCHRKCT